MELSEIKLNKKMSKKILIFLVIINIFLLINTVCAHSYFISESSRKIKKEINNKKQKDLLLHKSINLLISFFSIKQIGIVSAEEEKKDLGERWAELMGYDEPNYGNIAFSSVNDASDLNVYCCKEKINGGICENLFAKNKNDVLDLCSSENILSETSCDETNECELGCCVYNQGEVCSPNSAKWKCEEQGGVFKQDASCDGVSVCEKGCCVYGNSAKLTTAAECQEISNEKGIEMNYNPTMGEIECIESVENNELEEGACVIVNDFGDNDCKRTLKSECDRLSGKFYKGYLCTHPDLGTKCNHNKNEISTKCLDDGTRDGVYFVDSCGNIANIYNYDLIDDTDYWSYIKTREESCNPNQGNAGSSSCGNCKLEFGSICAEDVNNNADFGDYICKDLNCNNAPSLISPLGEVLETKDRKNGESWCLYDSAIGTQKSPYGNDISADPVGSLHWRATCLNGEVKIENCGDYRTGICVENEFNSPDNSQSFTTAQCLLNQASDCIMFNSQASEECKGKGPQCKKDFFKEHCTKENTCRVQNVMIGNKFYFDICVPIYPRGNDLRTDDPKVNEMICGMAKQDCPIIYVTDWKGHSECKINCGCENPIFGQKLNDLSISLGDCGSYINYIGKATQNSKISGDTNTRAIKINDYSSFSNAISGDKVKPYMDEKTILELFTGESFNTGYKSESESFNSMISKIEGAGGIAYGVAWGLKTIAGEEIAKESVFNYLKTMGINEGSFLGPFLGATIGAAIGAKVGEFIGKGIGAEGKGAQAVIIACALGGGAIGAATVAGWTTAGGTSGLSAFGILGWIGVGVIITAVIWVAITGFGDVEEKHALFESQPWKAPEGGEDCHYCNEDKLGRPCTEYRCHSLGQACYLINKDTDKQKCVAMEDDGNFPEISPLKIINKNYEFADEISDISGGGSVAIKNLETDEKGRNCINNFEKINFIMQTDEYAQCRYSFQLPNSPNFEDLPQSLDGGALLRNHTFNLNFLSIDFLKNRLGANYSNELRKQYSDMRIYLRCKDSFGYYNLDPYMINFCVYEDDKTAVDFGKVVFSTNDEGYLPYNTTKKVIKMWLPEPAECSYSLQDKEYVDMENKMNCDTKLIPSNVNGWECNTTLNNLKEGENKFYIRCNDSVGNINNQGFEYNFYITKNKLVIDSVNFTARIDNKSISTGDKGTMGVGRTPVSVEMKVKTSGGVKNGKAICKWETLKGLGDFFKSDIGNKISSIHKQILNFQLAGKHIYKIECEDNGGNIVKKEVYYNLENDQSPPVISRIYYEGGSLKIKTTEPAECYVNNKTGCNFNQYSSGVKKMNSLGLSKDHSINWESNKEYYIKCFDKWGNPPKQCSVIIKADKKL